LAAWSSTSVPRKRIRSLAGELPFTRPAVAKHLGRLRSAGLVSAARSGRETRYRLTLAPLGGALDWMEQVGAQWDDRLVALRVHLERGAADPRPS
jgi:DNA-binding transcriptional ArsR family regulator